MFVRPRPDLLAVNDRFVLGDGGRFLDRRIRGHLLLCQLPYRALLALRIFDSGFGFRFRIKLHICQT
ncbi:protein of unknown function [Pararobbsia alpina]